MKSLILVLSLFFIIAPAHAQKIFVPLLGGGFAEMGSNPPVPIPAPPAMPLQPACGGYGQPFGPMQPLTPIHPLMPMPTNEGFGTWQ